MTSTVCTDAGIVIKLVIQEADSDLVHSLWHYWLQSDTKIVAPGILPFEITAVIRKLVYQGRISLTDGHAALRKALAFAVTISTPLGLHQAAWDLATRFNHPTAYDAHYLALAEMLSCEFWTADRRLYNAVHTQLPWVKCLGDFQPPTERPMP